MSEPHAEPLAEHLSRFTPDGSGFDRDSVLYAAGKAAARPNRGWIALAICQGLCQLLVLALLWPVSPPPQLPVFAPPNPVIPSYSPPAPTEPLARWRLQPGIDEEPPPPRGSDDLIPEAPPLRAFAAGANSYPDLGSPWNP